MEHNESQKQFLKQALMAKTDKGWGVSQVSIHSIVHVVTRIVCPQEDEKDLRQRIYQLELELMESDPDNRYDFQVIVKHPLKT